MDELKIIAQCHTYSLLQTKEQVQRQSGHLPTSYCMTFTMQFHTHFFPSTNFDAHFNHQWHTIISDSYVGLGICVTFLPSITIGGSSPFRKLSTAPWSLFHFVWSSVFAWLWPCLNGACQWKYVHTWCIQGIYMNQHQNHVTPWNCAPSPVAKSW